MAYSSQYHYLNGVFVIQPSLMSLQIYIHPFFRVPASDLLMLCSVVLAYPCQSEITGRMIGKRRRYNRRKGTETWMIMHYLWNQRPSYPYHFHSCSLYSYGMYSSQVCSMQQVTANQHWQLTFISRKEYKERNFDFLKYPKAAGNNTIIWVKSQCSAYLKKKACMECQMQ